MTASRSVEVRIPLRWADMDANGHVNNIAVVQLLAEARVAAFGGPANTGAGGGQAPPIDLLEGVAPGVRTFISEHTAAPLIMAAHVMLSLGLAFMFTPLFTSALGSLKPSLYAHGSATVGTVQQVAGAAGTALFVTIMSVRSLELVTSGTAKVTADAAGIQTAFLIGAIISLLAVVGTFFIRRAPEPTA